MSFFIPFRSLNFGWWTYIEDTEESKKNPRMWQKRYGRAFCSHKIKRSPSPYKDRSRSTAWSGNPKNLSRTRRHVNPLRVRWKKDSQHGEILQEALWACLVRNRSLSYQRFGSQKLGKKITKEICPAKCKKLLSLGSQPNTRQNHNLPNLAKSLVW